MRTRRGAAASEAEALVARSVRRYKRAHRRYDRKHPEIFNPVEQARLRNELARTLETVGTRRAVKRVLDLGCGSGNVTRHLLELGAQVVAADVSPHFLAVVRSRHGATGAVETHLLNGVDLAGIPDASMDMVCAYSVLHHIPDYLGMVAEICRVLAPGGMAYLDHEANHNFWDKSSCFWELLGAVAEARVKRQNRWNGRDWWHPQARRWQRYVQPARYWSKARRLVNPAYPWDVEGDIHVWPHDHIEWDRIDAVLSAGGCEVFRRVDYLNYSADYPDEVWERFEDRCTNMRLTVARRTATKARRHWSA